MVTCKLECTAKVWTVFGGSPASIQHEIAKCRSACHGNTSSGSLRRSSSHFFASVAKSGSSLNRIMPGGRKNEVILGLEFRALPPPLQCGQNAFAKRDRSLPRPRLRYVLIAVRIDAGQNLHLAPLKTDVMPAQCVKLARPQAGRGGEQQLYPKVPLRRFEELAHDFLAGRNDLFGLVGAGRENLHVLGGIEGQKVEADGIAKHHLPHGNDPASSRSSRGAARFTSARSAKLARRGYSVAPLW